MKFKIKDLINNIKFINVLIVLFAITSCETIKKPNDQLYPLMWDGNLSYLPKPILIDSLKPKMYVSGRYLQFDARGTIDGNAGELQVSRANTYQNFNMAYGITLNAGSVKFNKYDKEGLNPTKQQEGFSSVRLLYSIQAVEKYKKLEFRYLGLDAGYSKESGYYQKARQKLLGNEYYTIIRNTDMFSLGVSSELAGGSQKNFSWAVKLGVGKNLGDFNAVNGSYVFSNNKAFFYSNIYLKYKRLFFINEIGYYTKGTLGFYFTN